MVLEGLGQDPGNRKRKHGQRVIHEGPHHECYPSSNHQGDIPKDTGFTSHLFAHNTTSLLPIRATSEAVARATLLRIA